MAPIIIQHGGKLKAGVWLTLKHFAVCLRVMETAPQANWSPPQACLTLSEPKFKDLSKLQVRTALQTLKIYDQKLKVAHRKRPPNLPTLLLCKQEVIPKV